MSERAFVHNDARVASRGINQLSAVPPIPKDLPNNPCAMSRVEGVPTSRTVTNFKQALGLLARLGHARQIARSASG